MVNKDYEDFLKKLEKEAEEIKSFIINNLGFHDKSSQS